MPALRMQYRLVAAVIVCVVAGLLVVRAVYRASPAAPAGPASDEKPVRSVSPASAWLAGVELDTVPTRATLPEVAMEFRARVEISSSGASLVTAARRADLASAASERLMALLDRDAERERSEWAARGGGPFPPISEGELRSDETVRQHFGMAPLALAELTVVDFMVAGRWVGPENDPLRGMGVSTAMYQSGPKRLDVPKDWEKAGADIVEVRLPVRVKTLDGKEPVVVLGIGLLWHETRRQWLPVFNRLHYDVDARYFSPFP